MVPDLAVYGLSIQDMIRLCLMITGSSGGNEDVFGISNPCKACQAQAGLTGITGFPAQDFPAGKLCRFHILEHGAVKGKAVRM